jgi:hypothetical protein
MLCCAEPHSLLLLLLLLLGFIACGRCCFL